MSLTPAVRALAFLWDKSLDSATFSYLGRISAASSHLCFLSEWIPQSLAERLNDAKDRRHNTHRHGAKLIPTSYEPTFQEQTVAVLTVSNCR